LFLGKIAPIDISDVCGMNLWDIPNQEWSKRLLEIVGGSSKDLLSKLGKVEMDGGRHLGNIHPYFISRYNVNKS
jgi:xylulokinase